jgi:uncharacterized membrane protein YdjX (TVP38/TMEM64 family)
MYFSSTIHRMSLFNITMLILFLLVALITVPIQGESITSISSGTGFGTCTGYCYKTMTVNPSSITTLERSSTDRTT